MINLSVPFYCQRDNKYVWHQKYALDFKGVGKKGEQLAGTVMPNRKGKPLGPITCNITSLCMILHYFGITQDSPDDMLYKIFDSEEYKNNKFFSSWRTTDCPDEDMCPGQLENADNLFHVAEILYGLKGGDEIATFYNQITLERAKQFVQNGMPVWFSYGALKKTGGRGHIAVLRGYNDDGFIVNDPYGNVGDPDGFLKQNGEIRSYTYYYGDNNITSGWGSGDNSFIQTKEFKKLIEPGNKFYQALVIRPKKIWFFPSISQNGQKELSRDELFEKAVSEEVRIQTKTKSIIEASFPICENGCWHTGVHIKGSENKEIMPIGPGRLVAARNSDLIPIDSKNTEKGNKSNNFILIRHNIPGTKDFFYSYYLHLEKIDIQARLLSNLQFETVQDDNRDWLNQIIDHVMPKRLVFDWTKDAILYIKDKDGKFKDSGIKGYKKTTAYYYPAKDEDVERIWSLSNPLQQALTLVNDMKTYLDSTKKYYRIMLKEYVNYNYCWKEYYISMNEKGGFAQKINDQEFSYYFNQLKNLNEGNTVVFNSEDTYKTELESPYTNLGYEKLFYDVVKKKLGFNDLKYYGGCKKELWKKIKDFYLNNKESYTIFQIRNELYDLSKYLLNYPYSKILKHAFEVSDNFFVKDLKDCYKYLYEKFENSSDFEQSWEQLYFDIRINYETNPDFYIEMNSKTPLGKFGLVGNERKVHFDIFSNKDFIDSENHLEFDVTAYDVFYNKKESVKLFQQKLNVEKPKKSLSQEKLSELYEENREIILTSQLEIKNDIIKPTIAEEKEIENAVKKSVGFNEQNDSYREKKDKVDEDLFIEKENIDDVNLKSKTLFYYYPANAIFELNEKITKEKLLSLFK